MTMARVQVAVLLAVLAACASAQQCLNDCSGHGDCNAGVCTCETGWDSEDCSVYKCASHTDGCSGHGQCRTNGCVCHAGYGGHNCASLTTNCPDHCKGHGQCLDGECTCDKGYKGVDCGLVDSTYSCTNNCSGHGFCDLSNDDPTCVCMPSFWSGEACDIEQSRCPVELNNCTGHGICGPSNPLESSSEWVCACEAGFCGDACNRACPACPNNCTGHGICQGSTCSCDLGFAGDDCTLVVAIPDCPNNCSGHGRCREVSPGTYGCDCETGYEGASCVFVDGVCPGNCSGKGECLPGGSCACIPGYNGTACQIALGTCAASNNCSANGMCVNGACRCYPGFSGSDCSLACHTGGIGDIGCNADLGHGVCLNGTCVCKEGEWQGVGCEERVHSDTLSQITSSNNPIGIIVLSIVGAAALLLLAGAAYNYTKKGKRGLNAVPGMDRIRSSMKGDDYEAAPENRYASNY